ncbi:MAG: MBL fold metallo-hydrolase [Patescibacteria group bacterium]|nr:MBL fold metallo-hydrolase [Patescibacteria group bacterium]
MYFSKKQKINFLFLIILLSGFLGFNVISSNQDNDKLRINFFDIGQGDSTFIQTPYKQDILIDGGPDNTIIKRLNSVMPFYDRTIDLIIISHHHSDHITGIIKVLNKYNVKEIYYNGVFYPTKTYGELLRKIKEKNIKLTLIKEPREVKLGNDLILKILFPDKDLRGKEIPNLNNTSIVAKLLYKNDSILLIGDAELEEEQVLLENNLNLNADILKVGHQGAINSSSKEFLKEVIPKIAVISVGADNKFGHPSRRVIKRLERLGARVYRTDHNGTVNIISNGNNNFLVKTER